MTEHDLFEHETELTREDAAALVGGVADDLRRGGPIAIDVGGRRVSVDGPPDESLTVEVEVEVGGHEESPDAVELELELEWTIGGDTAAVEAVAADEGAGVEERGRSDAETIEDDGDERPEQEPIQTDGDRRDEDRSADGTPVDPDAPERRETEVQVADAPAPDDRPDRADGSEEPSGSLGVFQLYRDRADEWRWRLVHRNGNIIATGGEGYASRANVEKGMRSVMRNARDARVVVEGREESAEPGEEPAER